MARAGMRRPGGGARSCPCEHSILGPDERPAMTAMWSSSEHRTVHCALRAGEQGFEEQPRHHLRHGRVSMERGGAPVMTT